jgi:hypothetical protein
MAHAQEELCLAYVDGDSAEAPDLTVQIRAHNVPANRVTIPFYPSKART